MQKLLPNTYPLVKGLGKLYNHQVQTIRRLLGGISVVLVAGTGSGKTEAVFLGILELLISGKLNHCLIFYPTKDLARDQETRIKALLNKAREELGVIITYASYHGDTPPEMFQKIEKDRPQVLIATMGKIYYRLMREANPAFKDYLLSAGLLWLDEAHAAMGHFAAHLHYVLQLYRKVNPNVITALTTATIAAPEELVTLYAPGAKIIQGGTRRGNIRIHLVKRKELYELIRIQVQQVLGKPRTAVLVFIDSKLELEHLTKVVNLSEEQILRPVEVKEVLKATSDPLRVEGFSGDYSAFIRSRAFQKVRSGLVKLIFTTSSLELGIDLSSIITVINVGYPITGKSGLLQRIGRLRTQPGDTRDFFLVLNPKQPEEKEYWTNCNRLKRELEEGEAGTIRAALVNREVISATLLYVPFLKSMAKQEIFELFRGDALHVAQAAFASLLADGYLTLHEGNIVHSTPEQVRNWLYSHKLRATPEKFKIQAKRSDGQVEEYWMDTDRVPFRALPGNLLERRGRTFLVTSLDPENFIIEAKELTQAIIHTLTVTRNTIEEKLSFTRHMKRCIMAGVLLECGNALLEVKPKILVTVLKGRTMKKELSEEDQRKHTFHLPTHSVSIRFTGEAACRNYFSAAYTWHILEILAHAILRECHRRFGYSFTQFGTKLLREERRILIYDRCLSAKATKTIFTHFPTILKGIIEQLKRCECKFGCQRCTGVFYSRGKKSKLIYNPKQLCKVVVEGLL